MIDVENLTKYFKTIKAVDDITFKVEEKDIFGFLGPNGSGKTTTVRLLTGLLSPTSGSASVAGYDIVREPMEVRRRVGVLTETPNLYDRLSIIENLEYYGVLFEVPKKALSERIHEYVNFMGLWDRRNDKTGVLSKGMKQKVAIIRALLHDPPIIFLDEPTSGLDPQTARSLQTLIKDLVEQESKTIFLCTHNLAEAQILCNKVAVMRQGKIARQGSISEIINRGIKHRFIKAVFRPISDRILNQIKAVEGVHEVIVNGAEVTITVDDPELSSPIITRRIVEAGGVLISINATEPSLEDLYFKAMEDES